MKYIISFLSIFFFFACSKDDSAGSRTFIPDDLTVLSLTSIRGETVNAPAGDAGSPTSVNIIYIQGTVDSQSGLELTGLKVRVRVLGDNGTPLGISEDICTPAEIAPGGSCTFSTSVVLEGADYKTSQSIEITPGCDQGNGTLRLIPVTWPNS
ncbi:MAG: FxLYD domain-containing protein [Gemmatimonadota bacterium]|nr:FxLYD domain-containing protein [Gemmatimonadota bacterium]MDE2832444.1 FxLYD domain-containing protein [Gemmatimonadota bacterium]MDE2953145.1 FxLYD domain-containing protein [Gemmatimonadota bacterium]